jgi:hypothetical protein
VVEVEAKRWPKASQTNSHCQAFVQTTANFGSVCLRLHLNRKKHMRALMSWQKYEWDTRNLWKMQISLWRCIACNCRTAVRKLSLSTARVKHSLHVVKLTLVLHQLANARL